MIDEERDDFCGQLKKGIEQISAFCRLLMARLAAIDNIDTSKISNI